MNEPSSQTRACDLPCTPLNDAASALTVAIGELRQLVEAGFAKQDAAQGRQEQSIALVIGDQKAIHARVAALEARVARVEDTPSEHDIKTGSALDEEIAARQALSGKVDALLAIATRFERGWDKLMANPRTKLILAAVAYAAYRYLDSHGLPLPSLPGLP